MRKDIVELLQLNHATEYGKEIEQNLKSTSQYFLKKAEATLLETFEKIQNIQDERDTFQKPMVGDYVKLSDNTYRMIAICRDEKCQLYPQEGHYCCLYSTGEASASGTLDEPISINSLELTEEIKEGLSWAFLFEVGAHKGVNFNLDYKVWKIK